MTRFLRGLRQLVKAQELTRICFFKLPTRRNDE
jgi:hypothetical protein